MLKQLCLVAILAVLCVESRRKTNCGLTCYRWGKCMRQISEGKGELGDTGIVVLNKCSPMENGCNCAEILAEENKTSTTTSTTESTRSDRLSPSKYRNSRLPRKDRVDTVKKTSLSEEKPTEKKYSSRKSGRYSSRRYSSRRSESEAAPEVTKTTSEISRKQERRSFFTRRGRGATRFRLADRL